MSQEHDQHALYSGTNLLGLGYKIMASSRLLLFSWSS